MILVAILAFYGSMQLIHLIEFEETDVKTSSRDAYFDSDFVYSDHLWYAFGVTAYDSNPESIEDPSIGEVKAYYKTWGGLASDSVQGIHYEEIPLRECTEAEL